MKNYTKLRYEHQVENYIPHLRPWEIFANHALLFQCLEDLPFGVNLPCLVWRLTSDRQSIALWAEDLVIWLV